MPFPYYDRLSARDKAIYRRSDEVTWLAVPGIEALRPLVDALRTALVREDRLEVERVASRLANGLCDLLGMPPLTLKVLAVRPSSDWGELHGLYTREPRLRTRIELWMRTARLARVVAFRTFLRTLLHEVGHHVDYEHLQLRESFHTQGFFSRESSLFKQLVPDAEPARGRGAASPADQDSDSPRPGRK
jgi:hypothetical protein